MLPPFQMWLQIGVSMTPSQRYPGEVARPVASGEGMVATV